MPLRVGLTPGLGADLRVIAAELRSMDDARVGRIFRARLRNYGNPVMRSIRARILAIPTHGAKHTGLRLRLAGCLRISSRTTGKNTGLVIWMDVTRMPAGQYSLPSGMEGKKVWAHPVFGKPPWVVQGPHPYFYPVALASAPLSLEAIEAALDEIRIDVSGS
jgi:hypothetical protein